MNPISMLVPIFIRHDSSLNLLMEVDGTTMFSRLLAAMRQHADVIMATDVVALYHIARAEGVETIFIEDVTTNISDALLPGWREAGEAVFSRNGNEYLVIADFAHPFAYSADINLSAETWIRSKQPVAFTLEEANDHPCQVEIRYSKRIEAIAYQPVPRIENALAEAAIVRKVKSIYDISPESQCGADECWAIPVVDGGARGDLLEVVTFPEGIKNNGEMALNFPPNTQNCLLLWLSKTQSKDDPLTVPLEMKPRLWRVCSDGNRYLMEKNQPITGRQMFPTVLQLSPAAAMVRRDSWSDVQVHLEKNTFHPLLVDRNSFKDPELDAVLGLLELIERSW